MIDPETNNETFSEGDKVIKTVGDYAFDGVVLAVFQKRSGKWRYVVENADGILHIFSGRQLVVYVGMQNHASSHNN